MTIEELKFTVDYYLQNSSGGILLYLSMTAAFVSFAALVISVVTYIKQRREFKMQHEESIHGKLHNIWHDVLNTCLNNPKYLDINVTEHYFTVLANEDTLKYDVYCQKAWSHIQDIVSKNLASDPQYEPIIEWVTAYHYTWLRRNPAFFKDDRLWEIVDSFRNKPSLIFSYKKLPDKDTDIDWNQIASEYNDVILSPFADEMVLKDESGLCPNLLLNYLNNEVSLENAETLHIADFGCGPGNLIRHLPTVIKQITLIDKSENPLKIAAKEAEKFNIEATTESSIFNLSENEKFDYIISVNSVLPSTRAEVLTLLTKMRSSLTQNGKLIMILPSFDTVLYMHRLWEAYYKNREGISSAQVTRILQALAETKKLDVINKRYADDGQTQQCYHDKESIPTEFNAAGLTIVGNMEKVKYPWDLVKRFDYGYFPKEERIWDWFVVAKRST